MIRIIQFAFVAVTGLICLCVYRTAEQARVSAADLRVAQAAIMRENQSLTILGAEWARLTQPARIQALADRHLDLSDRPAIELTSLTQLPPKNPPLAPQGAIRNANAVVPRVSPPGTTKPAVPAASVPAQSSDSAYALIDTGT